MQVPYRLSFSRDESDTPISVRMKGGERHGNAFVIFNLKFLNVGKAAFAAACRYTRSAEGWSASPAGSS